MPQAAGDQLAPQTYARRTDFSRPIRQLRRDPRTNAVQVRAPLTWCGVRTRRLADGSEVRELRRPEQVRAPSHLRKLVRLGAPIGHPEEEWQGRRYPVDLWTGALDDSGPDATGRLRRDPRRYVVGWTGDQVDLEDVEGHALPVAWVTIFDERAARLIEAGYDQTSLDYGVLLVRAPAGATWTDPATGEALPYDVEHVLDEEDPRVAAAIAAGVLRSKDDLGPNHFGVAIRRGVGGSMSRLRDSDSGAWRTTLSEFVPATGRARVDAAARTAEAVWWDVPQLLGDHPSQSAPIERYGLSEPDAEGERRPLGCGWLGWSEAEDGSWIVFWSWDYAAASRGEPEGGPAWGLLWTARAPDGSVVGDPTRVLRSLVAPQPTLASDAADIPAVGDRLEVVGPPHMEGQRVGNVTGIGVGVPVEILFDGEDEPHRWYLWPSELRRAPAGARAPAPAPERESMRMSDAQGRIPLRTDLAEPRLFAMVRNGDESGTSGTGRVLDGVVWGDGSVTLKWRSEAAAESSFTSWGDFHRVHCCAHPGNGTEFAWADGGASPECEHCGGEGEEGEEHKEGEGESEDLEDACGGRKLADGAERPASLARVAMKIAATALAAQLLAALPNAKASKRADSEIHDVELSGDAGEVVAALAQRCADAEAKAAKAAELDRKVGELQVLVKSQADSLKALQPVADQVARRALSDACAEGLKIAISTDLQALAAKAADAKVEVKDLPAPTEAHRLVCVAMLGDEFKGASLERVEGAYAALKAPKNVRMESRIPDPPPVDLNGSRRQDGAGDNTNSRGNDRRTQIADLG
mgnify:CR=1 FL=1